MKRLEFVFVLSKPRREPFQQLGMAGFSTVETEIAGRGDETLSEMVMPDSIDDDTGEKSVTRCSDPVGEFLASICVAGVGGELKLGGKSRHCRNSPRRNDGAVVGDTASDVDFHLRGLAGRNGVELGTRFLVECLLLGQEWGELRLQRSVFLALSRVHGGKQFADRYERAWFAC